MEPKKSKISNLEWGLIIGVLGVIDIIQIILDLVAVGVAVNRFIDIVVGLAFALYLKIRGETLINPKRILTMLATVAGEMIPVVDALPLWILDGIFNMMISKSMVLQSAIKVAEMKSGVKPELKPKPENFIKEAYRGAVDKAESREKMRGRSFVEKINTSAEQLDALNKSIKERRRSSE